MCTRKYTPKLQVFRHLFSSSHRLSSRGCLSPASGYSPVHFTLKLSLPPSPMLGDSGNLAGFQFGETRVIFFLTTLRKLIRIMHVCTTMMILSNCLMLYHDFIYSENQGTERLMQIDISSQLYLLSPTALESHNVRSKSRGSFIKCKARERKRKGCQMSELKRFCLGKYLLPTRKQNKLLMALFQIKQYTKKGSPRFKYKYKYHLMLLIIHLMQTFPDSEEYCFAPNQFN